MNLLHIRKFPSLKNRSFSVNWFELLNSFLISWLVTDLLIAIQADQGNDLIIDIERFNVSRIIIFIIVFVICYISFSFIKNLELDSRIIRFFRTPVITILFICQCFRDWYFPHFRSYIRYYDTSSYTDFPHDLLKGEVDVFRTPVYPYFIKFIKLFSSNASIYQNIVYAQMAISLASVVILYFALRQILKNQYIVVGLCLLYGCSPAIISWDLCILTESLSLASTVLLLFFVLRYLKKPSIPMAITLGLYSFYMIMLRPTFIYLLLILAVFFILRFIFTKFDRRQSVAGFLTVIFSCCLTLGYCFLNYRTNNFFGLSSVSTTVNQLYIVINNNFYDNDKYPEISKYIDESIQNSEDGDLHTIIADIPEKFERIQIESYVKSCLKIHRSEYIDYTLTKVENNLSTPLASQYVPMLREWDFAGLDNALMNLMTPFTYLSSFVLIGIALIYAVVLFIRRKRIAWQVLGLSAFGFTHLFVSLYASMAEFSRLSIIVVPALLILSFYFIDLLMSSISKENAGNAINKSSVPLFESDRNYNVNEIYVPEEAETKVFYDDDGEDYHIVF